MEELNLESMEELAEEASKGREEIKESFAELSGKYVDDVACKLRDMGDFKRNLLLSEGSERFSDVLPKHIAERTSVALIGCGGIGNWVWRLLLGMGFTSLAIFDDDTVDNVNIGPQSHSIMDLGIPKVEAAKKAALLYRGVTIDVRNKRAGKYADLINELGYVPDIVIGATDSAEWRNAFIESVFATVDEKVSERYPKLFVDVRMAMGAWTCYAMPLQAFKKYGNMIHYVEYSQEAVFPPSEAVQEPCTARAIGYTGANIASYVAALVHWWVMEGNRWINASFSNFEKFFDKVKRPGKFPSAFHFSSRFWDCNTRTVKERTLAEVVASNESRYQPLVDVVYHSLNRMVRTQLTGGSRILNNGCAVELDVNRKWIDTYEDCDPVPFAVIAPYRGSTYLIPSPVQDINERSCVNLDTLKVESVSERITLFSAALPAGGSGLPLMSNNNKLAFLLGTCCANFMKNDDYWMVSATLVSSSAMLRESTDDWEGYGGLIGYVAHVDQDRDDAVHLRRVEMRLDGDMRKGVLHIKSVTDADLEELPYVLLSHADEEYGRKVGWRTQEKYPDNDQHPSLQLLFYREYDERHTDRVRVLSKKPYEFIDVVFDTDEVKEYFHGILGVREGDATEEEKEYDGFVLDELDLYERFLFEDEADNAGVDWWMLDESRESKYVLVSSEEDYVTMPRNEKTKGLHVRLVCDEDDDDEEGLD